MQKILESCKSFYFSNPNFAVRFFKLLLLIFIPFTLYDLITSYIIEDILHIEIPNVFDQLKKAHVPESVTHFYIIILGPIIETLLFQKWTFQIVKWIGLKLHLETKYGLTFNNNFSTIFAAFVFAGIHFDNHYLYPILVLPSGLLLGWIYLSNLQEFNSKTRAFWMTACFHILNNGFATIMYLLEQNS